MTTPKILTFDDKARFWAKVVTAGTNDCWEWQASRQKYGHGLFRLGRKLEKAHRISYILAHGSIPDDQIVRHRCDNPPCVNPNHLEVGTRADNVRDRDERGRHVALKGEQHGMAKLTEEQVRAIRRAPREWGMARKFADEYGVAIGTIYNIRSKRHQWAGVQ